MNPNVSSEMTKYIKGKPEELVTLEEAMADTGLTAEQVRYAMRRLIEKTSLGRYISVVSRGHAWQVGNIPGSKKKATPSILSDGPTPQILGSFTQVGVMKDGARVVRDESGKLYALTAL